MLRIETLLLTAAVIACSVGLVRAESVPAADAQYTSLQANPVRVAMFKNGLGLVQLEGELPDDGGLCRMTPLPNATAGSLWIDWPLDREVKDIVAKQVESHEEADAMSIAQLLQANIGQTVDILVDDTWDHAKIIHLTKPQISPMPRPEMKVIAPHHSSLLIYEDENQRQLAVPVNTVKQVKFGEGGGNWTYQQPQYSPAVEFAVSAAEKVNDAKPKIQVSYLADGIAWAPSYLIDISDPEKAAFHAKAVVVNDLVDLEGAQVDLIAGFPNIAHGNKPSMLSLAPLANLLGAYGQPDNYGRRAKGILSNQMRAPMMGGMPMMADMEMGGAAMQTVSGSDQEDLYYYHLDDITLAQGERGYYPLFTLKVDYEHIYTWDIGDSINEYSRGRGQPQSVEQVIWHSLKLKNTGDQPWTTAPAMTVSGANVLGQDTIKYTSPGEETRVRITQAMAVDAEHNEYEVSRERNAAKFYSRPYDQVTVQGVLSLVNHKKEIVTVEINKLFSGTIVKADANPKTQKLARGLKQVNPQSKLTWLIDVQPGMENTKTITYTYQVFVSH